MPRIRGIGDAVERWLEAERTQLPLWIPVGLGAGVAAWLVLRDQRQWTIAACVFAASGLAALALGRRGRALRIAAVGALLAMAGLALVWTRAERVAAPVLARPAVVQLQGTVVRAEPLAARGLVRVTLDVAMPDVPPKVRVNLAEADAPPGLGRGAVVALKARLMPPPPSAVPGAYDFERVAWFAGLGATGRGFAPVTVIKAAAPGSDLRSALTAHITHVLPGSAGGVAAALATGDEGAIEAPDADAMRRAGLAHLLSVSGLHITAVVGATMLLVLRLLALSPWLALRTRLPLVAAIAGAAAAIGYTLLTGSQVPTIRSCVAALLVLVALAMGREAMTLRLVATGATIVLLLWPETIAGPSFQLSFAAITAIVALHEHPVVTGWFEQRDEGSMRRLARSAASLLLTGAVVEAALMPIAVYHFHKAGMYGALVNIVAIPLTTFVIMPLEALALFADLGGVGAPFWWLAGAALHALLWLAHVVSAAPGSAAMLPAMPSGAFALLIAGGLWIALWRTRWRRLGAAPLAIGALWALLTPAPDLLITGDGRHVALRTPQGLALLRERAGDYTRSTLAENAGFDGEPLVIDDVAGSRCSRDACIVTWRSGSASVRILATRSLYEVPYDHLVAACARADIVISERRLPRRCTPHWLKLDRQTLARTGGVAVTLSTRHITTVRRAGDAHPWRIPIAVAPPLSRNGAEYPKAYPARGHGRGDNAADHKRGWRDRAGSSRPPGGNI
jgi:competence protein ComEC